MNKYYKSEQIGISDFELTIFLWEDWFKKTPM